MNSHKRGAEPGSSPTGKRQLLNRKLGDEIVIKQKLPVNKPGTPKEGSVKGGQYFMVLRLNSSITSDSSLTQWPCIVCDEKSHDFLFLGRSLFKPNSEEACRLSGNFTDGRLSKPDVPAIPAILLFLKKAIYVPLTFLSAVDDSTVRILMEKANNYPANFTSACRMMLEKRSLKWHVDFVSKDGDAAQGLSADKSAERWTSTHEALVPHVIVPQSKNLHSALASESTESYERDTDGGFSEATAEFVSGFVDEDGTTIVAADMINPVSPSFSDSSENLGQDAIVSDTVNEDPGNLEVFESGEAQDMHVEGPPYAQHAIGPIEHGAVKNEVPVSEQSMEQHHVKKEVPADQRLKSCRVKDEELLHGEKEPEDDVFNSQPCGDHQVRIFLKGGVQKFLDRKIVDTSKFLSKKLEKHMERGEFFVKCHTVEQISEAEFVPFVQFFGHGDFKPFLDESDEENPEIMGLDLHNAKACEDLAAKCIRLCLVAEALELSSLVQKAFGKLKILLPVCDGCSSEFVKVMRLIGFGNDVDIKIWSADYAAQHFYKLIEQNDHLVKALKNDSDFATMVHRRMADLPALDAKEMKKRKARGKKGALATSSGGLGVTTPKSGAQATPKKMTPSKTPPAKTTSTKQAAKKSVSSATKTGSKKSATASSTPAAKSPLTKKSHSKSKPPVLTEPSEQSGDDEGDDAGDEEAESSGEE